MPQDSLNFLQRIQEYGLLSYGWLLILSIWAGTAKYLDSLDGGKPTLMGWLSETCISGFVGVLAAMTCQYYQVDFLLTSAITGICAHNGAKSLSLIGHIIKKNSPLSNLFNQPTAQTKPSKKRDKK